MPPRSFCQSKALLDIALVRAGTLKLQFSPKSSLISQTLIRNLKRKPKILIPCSLKPAGVLSTFSARTGSGCKWVYLPNDSFSSNICPLFYAARRFLCRLLLNAGSVVKPLRTHPARSNYSEELFELLNLWEKQKQNKTLLILKLLNSLKCAKWTYYVNDVLIYRCILKITLMQCYLFFLCNTLIIIQFL